MNSASDILSLGADWDRGVWARRKRRARLQNMQINSGHSLGRPGQCRPTHTHPTDTWEAPERPQRALEKAHCACAVTPGESKWTVPRSQGAFGMRDAHTDSGCLQLNPWNAFLQENNSQYNRWKAQRELTSRWRCILKKLFSCQNKQMDPSPQCDIVFPSSLLLKKDIQWDKLGSKLGNNILCVSRTKEYSE